MAAHLHLYYIDWEEFHERFSVDLEEADKETETSGGIFADSFWGDNSYEEEEFYLRSDVFFLDGIYENLRTVNIATPFEVMGVGRAGKLLQWLLPLPVPQAETASKTLQKGTPEFEFYQKWMADFEFAFSRLMPYPFHESGCYKESPIDFSPLEEGLTISTLSPDTVRAVYSRFPSSAIIKYPTCKAIINTPPFPSDARCADHYYFALFLERLAEVVRKAVDENKGFCSFVV